MMGGGVAIHPDLDTTAETRNKKGSTFSNIMGQQHNKRIKKRRRIDYTKRKKAAAKAGATAKPTGSGS